MKYLDSEIIIDTISIDIAVLIFSILSLICSIITILIYLRVKSLRTIIYRLFFQIAINETITRCAHIIHFINLYIIKSQYIFDISITFIYFTDTIILIFIAYSCYAMYELILKQNKRINTQFSLFLNDFNLRDLCIFLSAKFPSSSPSFISPPLFLIKS